MRPAPWRVQAGPGLSGRYRPPAIFDQKRRLWTPVEGRGVFGAAGRAVSTAMEVLMRSGMALVCGALLAMAGCGGSDAATGSGNNGLNGGKEPGGNPPPTTVLTDAQPTTMVIPATPGPGTGPTTGGCPGTEPAAGSRCEVPGRLCRWTRDCGAGGVVGWCTAGKTWSKVEPTCQPGCPAFRPAPSLGSQAGPPPDARCTAGLECRYPSTPIEPGAIFHCNAEPDGRTIWPLPAGLHDGWVPAPAAPGAGDACGELARCGGASGCGEACPNPAPKACYCGPDGFFYCEISSMACGGGSATATTHAGTRE